MFAMLHHKGQGSISYAKFAQLERVKYRPSLMLARPNQLEENAKEIYNDLVKREYGIHNPTLLPECYLHVIESRSGDRWIMPIKDDDILDLESLVDSWLSLEYSGELERDGEICDSSGGAYFAEIKTDGNKLDSVVCWESGGFYTKATYC